MERGGSQSKGSLMHLSVYDRVNISAIAAVTVATVNTLLRVFVSP